MGPKMLPIALAYAQRAYLVVPIIDKAPKHAGGRGWPDGSRHLPEVEYLFARRRHTGIGIATGKASGVWVLDVDGDIGRASLQDLIDKHGPLPAGPVTVSGNGRHYWFSWTDDAHQLRNRVGFAPGLDVRTDGGGVVVPPSLHCESGRRYSWEGPSLLDMTPPAGPEWLIMEIVGRYPAKQDKATESPQQPKPVKKAKKDNTEIRDVDLYVDRALASAKHKILTASNGLQRVTLYTESLSAGIWLVGCTPQKCTKDKAFGVLVAAGMKMQNHKPKQEWTKAQVERVVNDGLDVGIGRSTNAA
jgi:hypothetical protein